MQKILKLLAVVFVWIAAAALSSFTKNVSEEKPLTLANAIQQKIVTAQYTGSGSYTGNAIKIVADNLSNKKISIAIPAGTMFRPSDETKQNILVTQEQLLVLNPREKKTTLLRGYCCEASDGAPGKDMAFSLSVNNDTRMARLFAFLKGKPVPDALQQEAVWCISNNHSVSGVCAPNMEMVRPLRDELCKITGQQDTWYSTPQSHTVDANGNISHATTEVSGIVKFKALKAAKVHNEVHDASGKLVMKNPNSFDVRPGTVEYEFGIRVQGWEKGTYFVKVFENDQVVHTQEFRI